MAIAPPRQPHPVSSTRQVSLSFVAQRDAAQRLSLAFSLLIRSCHTSQAETPVRPSDGLSQAQLEAQIQAQAAEGKR